MIFGSRGVAGQYLHRLGWTLDQIFFEMYHRLQVCKQYERPISLVVPIQLPFAR